MFNDVVARKDHQCLCCNGDIKKGDKYHVEREFMHPLSLYPCLKKYCKDCGPHIQQGLSFWQTRIKAFGSPYLRGWRRPTHVKQETTR